MDNRLKPYEEYRTVDLPWILNIPNHWKMIRNKNVLKMKKVRVGENHSQHLLLSLTKLGIIARDMVNLKGKFPKEFDSYQSVNSGDIVFCLFDIDETPRTVGLSSLSGMITGAYTVFEVEKINNKYLYYYYLSLDNHKQLKPLYTGLRKVINTDTFLRTKMPYPPKEEQDQIVRYLDWKLAKVNKFIKAKKKQIELLKEQKQAIINKAVTKGIDPNVNMKSSSIEWIGDIPNGWKVLFLFQTAIEQSYSNKGMKNNNLLSLSYGKIVNKDINTTDGLLPMSFENYQIVNEGNIILRLTDLQNDHKSLRVGIATQTGIITSAYTCLKVKESIIPRFLYLLLHSYDICKVFYGMGGGVRQSIGYRDISKLPIICPCINEQIKIINYCDNATNKHEVLIKRLAKEIALLEEYRTSLISDVVTGKVDVRNLYVEDAYGEVEIAEFVDIEDNEEELLGMED